MTDDPDGPWLFAYGTLGPRALGAGLDWSPDAVRGRLYDLGAYPVLVVPDDPDSGWVQGHVRGTSPGELEGPLDAYEGVADGLFRRIQTTTRSGRRAWVYVGARGVPEWAVGPLDRWDGPRSVPRHREPHRGDRDP